MVVRIQLSDADRLKELSHSVWVFTKWSRTLIRNDPRRRPSVPIKNERPVILPLCIVDVRSYVRREQQDLVT